VWDSVAAKNTWHFAAFNAVVGDNVFSITEWGEVWEYNINTKAWAQKSIVPNHFNRGKPVSFFINGIFYFGTGMHIMQWSQLLNDWWKYDPLADEWTHLNNFPGGARYCATAFSIGGKGYISCGVGTSAGLNDLWDRAVCGCGWR